MRAVSLDAAGQPVVGEVDEPGGDGELVRVLACGLCGSDIEKLRPEFAGVVLGHEVVAETADGRRVALVHHRGCGECERCRGGHESTCAEFARATIRPGGFAERVRADAWIDVPAGVDDARATALEPLACVVRGAERFRRDACSCSDRVRREAVRGGARAARRRRVRRGRGSAAERARAGRAGRRGRGLRARRGRDCARVGAPRRHDPRLRRRRGAAGGCDLPQRAHRRRPAFGVARRDACGRGAAPGARAAGADGAAARAVRGRARAVPRARRGKVVFVP